MLIIEASCFLLLVLCRSQTLLPLEVHLLDTMRVQWNVLGCYHLAWHEPSPSYYLENWENWFDFLCVLSQANPILLRLFGSKSLNLSAGAGAPLLYTRGVKQSGISVPDLCKHGMRLPLGISHVYTNIEGVLSASGRLFAAPSMFSVPVLPSLSSASAGNRLIFSNISTPRCREWK